MAKNSTSWLPLQTAETTNRILLFFFYFLWHLRFKVKLKASAIRDTFMDKICCCRVVGGGRSHLQLALFSKMVSGFQVFFFLFVDVFLFVLAKTIETISDYSTFSIPIRSMDLGWDGVVHEASLVFNSTQLPFAKCCYCWMEAALVINVKQMNCCFLKVWAVWACGVRCGKNEGQ